MSFRLDEHYLERLKREATKYGLSPGEYARRLVLDALEESQHRQVEEDLRVLKKEVAELRTDVAASVSALLIGAGKVTKDEARQWVHSNLKSR